jgi:tRNA G10  N-methylase Trm11
LPAYDARALVNIAAGVGGGVFLDPFAGVGGLVIEAMSRGCRVLSCDGDRSLRYGLTLLGASHVIADARRMPFALETVDSLATEPPYDPQLTHAVVESMHEGARVLRKGGRIAMLCAAHQADEIRRTASHLPLSLLHDASLDRKGVACAILAWTKL